VSSLFPPAVTFPAKVPSCPKLNTPEAELVPPPLPTQGNKSAVAGIANALP